MRLLTISVCLPLLACGDDPVKHLPDAHFADGPNLVDAAPLPVTLTITRDGTPMPSEHVYFQNADSTVVLATLTDATGTASAVMVAGGSVTTVNPYAVPAFGLTQDQLYTWEGVKPGDHLLLRQSIGQAGISFTITLPLSASQLVTQYEVSSPCGSGTYVSAGSGAQPTGTLYLNPCGTSTDLLVVAENGASPVEFFYLPNQAIADQQALDLSGQVYTAAAMRTYSYTNVPSTVSSIGLADAVVSTHGAVFQTYGTAPVTGTDATGQIPVPTFTGASDLVSSDFNPGMAGRYSFLDLGPYATTYTTDVAARLLPEYTGFPAFDPATHTLSWTEATGGVTPDLTMTAVLGLRQADGRRWRWDIVAPHAGSSVVFPTLPTDVYDFNFAAGEASPGNSLISAKVPGGYDAARPVIFAVPGPEQLITGATGQLTFEDLAPLAFQASRTRHPPLPRPWLRTRR